MRRFLKILLLVIGLGALFIALSPFWLGWGIALVAPRFGVTVGAYSRIGYSRFRIHGVTVQRRNVTVKVDQAEADTPWLWAMRHAGRRDRAVIAGNWQVHVVRSGAGGQAGKPSGWTPLESELWRIADGLDRWLPTFTVGHGDVVWHNGQLALESAQWSNRTLHARKLAGWGRTADVTARFPRDPRRIEVELNAAPENLVARAASEGGLIRGTVTIWGQAVPVQVRFPSAGWIPDRATAESEAIDIAGSHLRLPQYQAIQGRMRAAWEEGHFQLDVDLGGRPNPSFRVPPLTVVGRASGDAQRYRVDRLDISMPGVRAHLDQPFEAAFRGVAASSTSRFFFDATLDQLPWPTHARGTLKGQIAAEAQIGRVPDFRFQAAGANVASGDWTARSASVSGHLAWPLLEVDSLELSGDGATHVSARGAADFRERVLKEFRLEGHLVPELVQRWMPRSLRFSAANVVVVANGPFAAVNHEGTVEVSDLAFDHLTSVGARLWWRGTGENVAEAEAGIHNGTTEIVAGASLAAGAAEIKKLVWRQDDRDRLALQGTTRLTWRDGFRLDNLHLLGPAGELSARAAWSDVGELHVAARGIAAEWWRDFTPKLPFEWSIDTFAVDALWGHGPASFSTQGRFTVALPNRPAIVVNLSARSEGDGVKLERLSATEGTLEFAHLSGQVPVQVIVEKGVRYQLDPTAPFEFSGHVDPQAEEWTELAAKTGVRLEQPQLALKISGSTQHPRGQVTLAAARLELDPRFGHRAWPRIQHLEAELDASGDRLDLKYIRAQVEGQPVELSAVVPLSEANWKRLRTDPIAVLRDQAEVRLRAENTDLAALAPLVSEKLLPQGRFDADLTLSLQGDWRGHVSLRNLGTRPLGALGPLRDLEAELTLAGREIRLDRASLSVGGQTVKTEGTVTVPVGEKPRWHLAISGQNLPFVRESGLLIRGDVQLKVESGAGRAAIPSITGDVVFRDGIFVSDIRSMIPRGGATQSAERRPPYFAITTAPFSRWRLDVHVTGDHFLRARTTLLVGVASMKFHLTGTLGDPRSIGQLRVDDGQVLLPFARFELQDASVRVTDDHPFDPQLGVYGTSTRYGYDLKLEVTGSASNPNISFTSNPPLSSEQVLLLVMAGETPKNEVNYSTTQRFARLGTFFGQSLLGSLSDSNGEDRLTITTGEQISVTGHETYQVEYELNDRWSLLGEYDEFDDYNAGLKWRVLPKQRHAPR